MIPIDKVIELLKKIIHAGDRVQITVGALMMAIIVISVTLGIISRKVFGEPFPWTEELGVFLFVWISFLGANVTAARKNHVVVDILERMFSGKAAVVLKIIIDVAVIGFLIVLGWGALKLQPQTFHHTSVTLGIPKNFYYLPALITSFYMTVVFVCDLLEQIYHKMGDCECL